LSELLTEASIEDLRRAADAKDSLIAELLLKSKVEVLLSPLSSLLSELFDRSELAKADSSENISRFPSVSKIL
jgi:hypothetical protein